MVTFPAVLRMVYTFQSYSGLQRANDECLTAGVRFTKRFLTSQNYPTCKTQLITNFGIRYVSSLKYLNFSPNNRIHLMVDLI